MTTFEGFDGNLSPGSGVFHPKAAPSSAAGPAALPPGHPTFSVNKRKGASTPASFIKKVGG